MLAGIRVKSVKTYSVLVEKKSIFFSTLLIGTEEKIQLFHSVIAGNNQLEIEKVGTLRVPKRMHKYFFCIHFQPWEFTISST